MKRLFRAHILPPMRRVVRTIFRLLFNIAPVQLRGFDNYPHDAKRVLIIANHVSLLDGALLSVFLPQVPLFAINTQMAQRWWVRPFIALSGAVALDPRNAHGLKTLIDMLKTGRPVVIFPEGRLSQTGALMKIYPGPALAAAKANAWIVPVHIEGAQYSRLSRLAGKVPRRLLPPMQLTMLSPRQLVVTGKPFEKGNGREQRQQLARQLADWMEELVFWGRFKRQTLLAALRETCQKMGRHRWVIEEATTGSGLGLPNRLTFGQLLRRSEQLARRWRGQRSPVCLHPEQRVGVHSLANSMTLIIFFGLQICRCIPVLLDPKWSTEQMNTACQAAAVTAIADGTGNLQPYGDNLDRSWKAPASVSTQSPVAEEGCANHARIPAGEDSEAAADQPACLFVTWQERQATVLPFSHAEILAYQAQWYARFDFRPDDHWLSTQPLHRPFGLIMATLFPILQGMRLLLNGHCAEQRHTIELAYEHFVTVLMGDSKELQLWSELADAYDFVSVRRVVASEPVSLEIKQRWLERFSLRVYDCFGIDRWPMIACANPRHGYVNALPEDATHNARMTAADDIAHPRITRNRIGPVLPGFTVTLAIAGNAADSNCQHPSLLTIHRSASHPLFNTPQNTARVTHGSVATGTVVQIDSQGILSVHAS